MLMHLQSDSDWQEGKKKINLVSRNGNKYSQSVIFWQKCELLLECALMKVRHADRLSRVGGDPTR